MAVNPDVTVLAGTPMTAGIGDTLWSMTDLAELVDATLPEGGPRGPYKKENSNRDTTRRSFEVEFNGSR
jgi:hypothetical protein